jgi:hypothetical protein
MILLLKTEYKGQRDPKTGRTFGEFGLGKCLVHRYQKFEPNVEFEATKWGTELGSRVLFTKKAMKYLISKQIKCRNSWIT